MFRKKMAFSALLIAALLVFGTAETGAQEFGFGAAELPATALGIKSGGNLAFSILAFPVDLGAGNYADSMALPEARLKFEAAGARAEGFLGLHLTEDILKNDPAALLDEAWLRIYAGKTIIQAGLQRASWGRADSLSVLDVVNPRDLSNLTLRDEGERKIAVPMVRLTQALGERANAELVYLPWFEGDRIATSGPWVPSALATGKANLQAAMADTLYDAYAASLWASVYAQAYSQTLTASGNAAFSNTTATSAANTQVTASAAALTARASAEAAAALADPFVSPDTKALNYGQAGLRFNAGLGAVDLGIQYFYGYITTPAYDMNPASITAAGGKIPVSWNPYHQVGIDMAAVVSGFNLRVETGINLTADSSGADPLVYNSSIVWAAGFDRNLFAGIDLNLQAMGKVRLNHEGIASPLDVEYGSKVTSTRIAAMLSRSFARDAIKLELLGLYEIEKMDYMVEPGLVFSAGDAEIALRGRYFGGDATGDLGQFADKSYISISTKYAF